MPHRPHHKEQALSYRFNTTQNMKKNTNEIIWKRCAYSQKCDSNKKNTLNLLDNETTRFGLKLALQPYT